MSMSSFRLPPKIRHVKRIIKKGYGYLSKTTPYAIRHKTELQQYSHLPVQELDWERTMYGKVVEGIPKDAPDPLVHKVITAILLKPKLD